jgi:hypothetical protein
MQGNTSKKSQQIVQDLLLKEIPNETIRESFLGFINDRFAVGYAHHYISQWITRLKVNTIYENGDGETRQILKKYPVLLNNEVYGKITAGRKVAVFNYDISKRAPFFEGVAEVKQVIERDGKYLRCKVCFNKYPMDPDVYRTIELGA